MKNSEYISQTELFKQVHDISLTLDFMDALYKKWRRRCLSRISVYLMCLLAPILCLLCLINSELPEVSLSNSVMGSPRNLTFTKTVEGVGLGELGDMMVAMLPDDLAFTIFVPSEEAFGRLLKLRSHDSLSKDRLNETYAVVSRVMGFSAVPQHIPSKVIPLHKEMTFESVSGFRLYAWKDLDGTLVVNGIRSEVVDIRKAEIIVHKMDGVLMDAEFEQSFPPDYED
ncbi:uncharacterized protein LOC135622432 [Musa acuminata AAA Group]|uniref:uncharacterized protein LOC103996871 n=1 Tax=Musa acuminata AAA Group TaxID=214697 RepID=UPI0031D96A41